MRHPRVAFLDQTAKLGGAELSLLDIVSRRGRNDRVILFEDGPFVDLLRSRSVDVVTCPLGIRAAGVRKDSGLWSRAGAAASTIAHVRRLASMLEGFDLLYVNTAKAAVLGAMANARSGRPMIYHLRDFITPTHFSSINRKLLVRTANHCAARVIANSSATAEAFVAAGGRPDLVTVVPNGFDVGPFDEALAERDRLRSEARREHGLSPDAAVVALFGRLADWKGQHVAVEAIERLPGVHLLLVGDALFGEDDYKAKLARMVEQRGLTGRVHFLGFRDDVRGLMQAADIVVHASTAPEPFGRVIVEAMLSERPVVASRGGGALEILSEGETGLFCEMGDPASLAAAVQRLLESPELSRELSERGRRSARQRFRIEECVKRIDEVISKTDQCSRRSVDGVRLDRLPPK